MATESTPPQPPSPSPAAAAEENPQPPPSTATPKPSPEALRLREAAEAKLRASAYTSALKYARRAAQLSPGLPGVSDLVNICKILSCDPSDPYRIFSLAPTSSLAAVRRRYKTLALSLQPTQNPGVAAEEAFKRVSAAFRLLTEKHKKGAAASFWTACGACRLLHEFDRKYVGYRLVCPGCRKSFLASEVPAPADNGADTDAEPSIKVSKSSVSAPSKSSKRKAEKTLPEIQVELPKNKKIKQKTGEKENSNKKKKEDSEMEDDDDEEDASDMALRHTKQHKGRDSCIMAVEDSDFYNFDTDRDKKCFRKGQIWAIYDDDDLLPRYYGLIEEVFNSRRFSVRLRWLEVHSVNKSYGLFKLGKTVDFHSVNLFSHSVWYERAAMELYRIYPKKGSVWALYSDKKKEYEYDIILALTSYSEAFGLSFAYLEKVEGYKTIFKRRAMGSAAVRCVDKEEGLRVFSHQIPARLVKELDGVDCWELDPASLPPQILLRLGLERKGS